MLTYLMTFAVIFLVMLAGIMMDRTYKRFQLRHPDLGPFRKPGGNCKCGMSGDCDKGGC